MKFTEIATTRCGYPKLAAVRPERASKLFQNPAGWAQEARRSLCGWPGKDLNHDNRVRSGMCLACPTGRA
eukprot:7916454-Pyramimonas_sp.AAC.1